MNKKHIVGKMCLYFNEMWKVIGYRSSLSGEYVTIRKDKSSLMVKLSDVVLQE